MMTCDDATLQKLVLHKVGNKTNGEKIHFSKSPYVLNSDISSILLKYFTCGFKSSQYYVFSDDKSLQYNSVYRAVCDIFEDNESNLYQASCQIAQQLYDTALHPNIKPGELYITYLTNCYLDGEILDAVGIFKSENRQTFLKVFPQGEDFDIQTDNGININKLDKGCIIFNKDKENGFVVSVVDTVSKGNEAVYWTDEFLHLMQRQDSYFQTDNVLNVCKNFVTDYLPQQYEMSKADQADILNRTGAYFKENKNFNTDSFNQKVFDNDELAEQFKEFKQMYQTENQVELQDDFILNEQALKHSGRYLRSVIKLDKNFTLYIHGKRERVEIGEDKQKGLRYYKLYFEKES